MTDRLKISIVTPNRNGAKFLEKTIRSVLDQGYQNLEYIVIDGASDDDSMAIIHRYRDRLSLVISEPDSGHTDAINKGLRAATGDVMGWSAAKHVGSFQWISTGGGALQGTITGNDSQIVSANQLNVDLSVTEEVWVKMKQTAGTKAKLCWAVNGSSSFLNCSAQFTVTPDNAFHTYRVSTAAFAGWHNQTLTRLRVEPSDTSTVTSGTFTVDSVRILEVAPP